MHEFARQKDVICVWGWVKIKLIQGSPLPLPLKSKVKNKQNKINKIFRVILCGSIASPCGSWIHNTILCLIIFIIYNQNEFYFFATFYLIYLSVTGFKALNWSWDSWAWHGLVKVAWLVVATAITDSQTGQVTRAWCDLYARVQRR